MKAKKETPGAAPGTAHAEPIFLCPSSPKKLRQLGFGVVGFSEIFNFNVEVEEGHLKNRVVMAYRGDTQLSESLLSASQLSD